VEWLRRNTRRIVWVIYWSDDQQMYMARNRFTRERKRMWTCSWAKVRYWLGGGRMYGSDV
jgi:hypothetical protein